jgi:hypothetical protein
MKDMDYGIDIIFSERKSIKSVFTEDNEISGDITNNLMLMPPASIYTKTAGTATSSVYSSQDFANEQVEVGA